MDDDDQTALVTRSGRGDLPVSPWAGAGLADGGPDGSSAAAAAGLASLSFIVAAIRRRTRFWCVAAAIGLILGAGLYLARPPAYTATTEALLTLGPNEDPATAIDTDVALAQSQPVAAIALHQLGLRESISTLLGSYTATPVTNRVIEIAVKAPSSGEAVRNANAVMAAFLQVRANQLAGYQRLLSRSLDIGVTQGKAQVAAITSRVNALTANPASAARPQKLNDLQLQLLQAQSTLASLEQSTLGTRQSTESATDLAIRASYVIDTATPVAHSRKKTFLLYVLTGLAAGLAAGMGFVVVEALTSQRLRWRDDIAGALDAPVRLSVPRVRLHRLLPGRAGLATASNPDVQRIARHLGGLIDDRVDAALAVVPVGRPDVAALALVALARARASQGKRVIVADLWPGAPAARLLGVTEPGIHPARTPDTRLAVAIPQHGDIAPAGPLLQAVAPPRLVSSDSAPSAGDLDAGYSSGDVLLTLAALDPMTGAEHLATWAADVVVVVTAGQSTWTRVRAVSEMIRLAGARLISAVLVGADKTDESPGMTRPASAGPDLRAAHDSSRAEASRMLAAADLDSGAEPPVR
jgi:capsular polysaccharide biosynthesis protein